MVWPKTTRGCTDVDPTHQFPSKSSALAKDWTRLLNAARQVESEPRRREDILRGIKNPRLELWPSQKANRDQVKRLTEIRPRGLPGPICRGSQGLR